MRIKALRTAAGLNQQQLAPKVGVGQGTLSRWESSDTEPCASELQRLATALRVNIHYLITGQGPEGLPGQQGAEIGVREVLARIRALLVEMEPTSPPAGGADPKGRAEYMTRLHHVDSVRKEPTARRRRRSRKKKGAG